jgi:hypothetical protein
MCAQSYIPSRLLHEEPTDAGFWGGSTFTFGAASTTRSAGAVSIATSCASTTLVESYRSRSSRPPAVISAHAAIITHSRLPTTPSLSRRLRAHPLHGRKELGAPHQRFRMASGGPYACGTGMPQALTGYALSRLFTWRTVVVRSHNPKRGVRTDRDASSPGASGAWPHAAAHVAWHSQEAAQVGAGGGAGDDGDGCGRLHEGVLAYVAVRIEGHRSHGIPPSVPQASCCIHIGMA